MLRVNRTIRRNAVRRSDFHSYEDECERKTRQDRNPLHGHLLLWGNVPLDYLTCLRIQRRKGRQIAKGHDDGDLAVRKIGRPLLEPSRLVAREPILDDDVAALDKAAFAQAFAESRDATGGPFLRAKREKSDHRQLARLLRLCRQRPSRRATEERDEIAPPSSR